MPEPIFEGVGVALVSLFDGDDRLLTSETIEHAASLVERGVAAVTVAGTTGEPWRLDDEDRVALVQACRTSLPRDVPVIAGTGHSDPAKARDLTARCSAAGADAVLVRSPADAQTIPTFYEQIAQAAAGVPVLAYHFPAFAPPGIGVDELADLPVAGIKDSSADADRLAIEIDLCDYAVYTGSANLLSLAGSVGAAGAILAMANAEPERCVKAFGGDLTAQAELAAMHLTSMNGFPRGLKALAGLA
ncbi:MAG TPA: dihydrodipicolinate synthase family protein [Solirubrobacterales bacterium]|nr:dihydrodipicolinate synthase family protein [Solirubrobacterales bacterium]